MKGNVVTRFAPSPTGHLHVGNVRTALFNFLIAKKAGGKFLLRFDDTDELRSQQQFKDSIRRDLEWLGLPWDAEIAQSTRLDRYRDRFDYLVGQGCLYECFESPQELELKRRLQLKQRRPPVYDRAALALSEAERQELRGRRQGYWRFRLDGTRTEWSDLIQGDVSIDSSSVSDPVLVRADGRFLYTFASVVDDLDMHISHIVRGADHVTNTGTQVQIMQALGGNRPTFAHHSLMTGPAGEPLSKRSGAVSIGALRDQGIAPEVVLSLLASIGSSRDVQLSLSIDELVDCFGIGDFNANPTRYDNRKLASMMPEFYRRLPYASVSDMISEIGVPDRLAVRFWSAIRGNIDSIADASEWWRVFRDGADAGVCDSDKQFVGAALNLLPDPPYDDQTWKNWTEEVGRRTGRRKAALYMPLRLAITGKRRGPSMADVMPLVQAVNRMDSL